MSAKCWIYEAALYDLLAEANRWRLRETGGALLGWRDGSNYVVHRVLGPGPNAKHGLSSFEPDAAWQAEEGKRIYSESGRTTAYVGDWHSHPRGGAQPSKQDIDTMEDIANDPDFRSPEPLSAIAVGPGYFRRRLSWDLNVFVWNGQNLVPTEVETVRGGFAARSL